MKVTWIYIDRDKENINDKSYCDAVTVLGGPSSCRELVCGSPINVCVFLPKLCMHERKYRTCLDFACHHDLTHFKIIVILN